MICLCWTVSCSALSCLMTCSSALTFLIFLLHYVCSSSFCTLSSDFRLPMFTSCFAPPPPTTTCSLCPFLQLFFFVKLNFYLLSCMFCYPFSLLLLSSFFSASPFPVLLLLCFTFSYSSSCCTPFSALPFCLLWVSFCIFFPHVLEFIPNKRLLYLLLLFPCSAFCSLLDPPFLLLLLFNLPSFTLASAPSPAAFLCMLLFARSAFPSKLPPNSAFPDPTWSSSASSTPLS